MTLLAEAKVQGSRDERPGLCPETDGRLEQNLAYSLPATIHYMRPPSLAALRPTPPRWSCSSEQGNALPFSYLPPAN